MKTINILGSEWTIENKKDTENSALIDSDGYCDNTVNKCVIREFGEPEIGQKENLSVHGKKVTRHEIIHAFLFESGLGENSEWAQNEEVVDWIAMQAPKMFKIFQELDVL